MSFSNYTENEVLDWIAGNGVPPANNGPYVQLHTADPGEDGTNAPAGNTTRILASFPAVTPGAGSISNDADVDWTNVSTAETYSHVSLWDAATAGNCLGAGALTTPVPVGVGDNFKIPAGDLDITLD
jgi:hypothetical protein